MCFDFLYKFYLKYFSFYEKFSKILSQMYIGLNVKYMFFCHILINTASHTGCGSLCIPNTWQPPYSKDKPATEDSNGAIPKT
jgi:hypothetical protein